LDKILPKPNQHFNDSSQVSGKGTYSGLPEEAGCFGCKCLSPKKIIGCLFDYLVWKTLVTANGYPLGL
jgi:hypothetical protein